MMQTLQMKIQGLASKHDSAKSGWSKQRDQTKGAGVFRAYVRVALGDSVAGFEISIRSTSVRLRMWIRCPKVSRHGDAAVIIGKSIIKRKVKDHISGEYRFADVLVKQGDR